MKNYLKTIKLCVALTIFSMVAYSCEVDPHFPEIILTYENALSDTIEIVAENSSNMSFFKLSIPSGESRTARCGADTWDDLFYPERITSIKVIFSDGKEYLSNDYHSVKSLLNESTYIKEENSYHVVIDEEYYESAE